MIVVSPRWFASESRRETGRFVCESVDKDPSAACRSERRDDLTALREVIPSPEVLIGRRTSHQETG